MDHNDLLADQFEANRGHLRAVAYRMLGSLSEADDAVQEAWFKFNRTDTSDVENLAGWLTTVVGRVCLDMLRARKSRREDVLDTYVPDPIVSPADGVDPEHEAVLADSVGVALLVVLDTLAPAERLAFVLHDMFAMPFDEIAPVVDRSPAATRQLASRARRRVQGATPEPQVDLNRQREVVDAFLMAARGGDFDALVTVLDPDVLLRIDYGTVPAGASTLIRSAQLVAKQALMFKRLSTHARVALVNGVAGIVTIRYGEPISVMSFTVQDNKVVQIDLLADPVRLGRLDLSAVGD